jgi:hypothetical protein
LERYRSLRIQRVAETARRAGACFSILSGEFGLLGGTELIPWYDHLLKPNEVEGLAAQVASQFTAKGAVAVRYFTMRFEHDDIAAYAAVIRQAGGLAGIPVEFVICGDKQRGGSMSDWRGITAKAEQAKRLLVADRPEGERQFGLLLSKYPGDGMLHLKRAEALEAVGETVAAASDYRKAQAMLPMAAWQKTAREGLARCGPTEPQETRTAGASKGWDDALLEPLPAPLQELWRGAVVGGNSNPRAQVALIRGAVERTVEHLLAVSGVASQQNAGLFDHIRVLDEERIIQPATISHLHTVRTLGNEAAHGGSVGDDELQACRIAGKAILKAVVATMS